MLSDEVVRLGRVGCGSPLDRGAEVVGLHKGVGPSFFFLWRVLGARWVVSSHVYCLA